jgi:periplasmic protein TonB
MFNKLIASAPDRGRLLRNPIVIFVSVAAHLLLLAGIVWASTRAEEEPPPEPERVTYIDITEIPPPEPDEVFEAAPEPPVEQPQAAPPAPRQTPARAPAAPAPTPRAPATPRNPQPSSASTEKPAGFQELKVPDVDVSGIPRPDLSAPPVRAEDFGGRGTPGGSASGAPPLPAPTAGRTGSATGSGSGTGSEGGRGSGTEGGTYTSNLVDEPAELLNRGDVARVLARRYPRDLQESGIEGRVVVQFIVDQNGRVEPGSIKVVSATQDGFVEATRTALQEFRFKPAKRQGRTVRQVVNLPVTWTVERR